MFLWKSLGVACQLDLFAGGGKTAEPCLWFFCTMFKTSSCVAKRFRWFMLATLLAVLGMTCDKLVAHFRSFQNKIP